MLRLEIQQKESYQRFNLHQRLQHIMMFSSFIILALTGLPIKYSDAGWATTLTLLWGGFDSMFHIHLGAAVVMLAASAYHLIYLIVYALLKRKISMAAVPNLKDGSDLVHNIRYFLGLEQNPPQFGRYSYKEKFDYLAVFWGMVIMGLSGLMLWFPEIAAAYMPRWVIDSARFAHSDEAMLAILAIVIWHFFNVHFNPRYFPMNYSWMHGNLSRDEMEDEHPLELEQPKPSGKIVALKQNSGRELD